MKLAAENLAAVGKKLNNPSSPRCEVLIMAGLANVGNAVLKGFSCRKPHQLMSCDVLSNSKFIQLRTRCETRERRVVASR